MTAKEYLQDLRRLESEVRTRQESIDRLRSIASAPRSASMGDRVTESRTCDLSEILARIEDLETEWNSKIDELIDKKRKSQLQIDKLETAEHREVLTQYYINAHTFEQTAVNLSCSYMTVCRWHGRALQEFERLNPDISKL